MLIRFILIALSFTTSYGDVVPWSELWGKNNINQRNPCKEKIAPLLNKMKADTDAKLSVMENYIQQILDTTSSKYRENTPDKLEKYLDQKFGVLIQLIQNNTNSKLIELENKIEKLEKIVTQYFNEPQSISHLDQHNMKNEKLSNTTCDEIERDINRKLDTIQKEMREFGNISTHCPSNVSEKLHGQEAKLNRKLSALEKPIDDVENVSNELDDKSKALKLMKNNEFGEITKEELKLCKEHVSSGYNFEPMFRLDNVTFDHVTLTNDSNGITDFEMHIAAKADNAAIVVLSPTPNPELNDPVYEIDMEDGGENSYTHLRIKHKGVPYKHAATPNILSRTHYKTFTIRISKGQRLEFIENTYEGEKPIITYTNPDLRLVNYIGFSSWFNNRNSWFLYDCPAWY